MVKTFVKVHFSIFFNLFLFYSLNLLVVLLFFFSQPHSLYSDLCRKDGGKEIAGLSFSSFPWPLALRHQSLAFRTHFCWRPKCETKCLRRRQAVFGIFSDLGPHSVFVTNSSQIIHLNIISTGKRKI